MRETFTYGSVRGAAGNGGSYRAQWFQLLVPAYILVATQVIAARS
jgi:hypothetical protein